VEERGVGLIGSLLEQRYRVDALLARGGMSSVYRGLDTRLDRRVAIKVMDARFADDRTFVDRFEREARSAAKIHHHTVVAVHDQGVDTTPEGSLVYLVMELVDGGTLRDLITDRGPLDVPLALSIVESVLTALTAAHNAGLVHRDVKPENVLIGHGSENSSVVKVGDFGLVRAMHSAGTTSSSVILGTVAYLSPEQVTTGSASARGDVYSAGIVLFEALTGRPPYTGDNALSIAYRHVNDDVPAPGQIVGGIPPELDELVLRVTRRDPAARPADGAAFLQELENLRARLSIPRVPVPIPRPHQPDRTMPVSPADRAAALVPPPTAAELTDTGVASGELTTSAAPATGATSVGNATIVRQAPAGFRPVGPQGTRAMLRTELDRSAPMPDPGPPLPPSGQLPVQQPPPPRQRPPAPPRPVPPPRNRTGQIVMWSAIAVLVLALVGTTTWWFTSGRYRTVPEVVGKSGEEAAQLLTANDLKPQVTSERHNTVPAGTVISTDPGEGEELLRGEPVMVVVSLGRPVVPNVEPGTPKEAAEQLIEDQKLQFGYDNGKDDYSNDVPKGEVLRLEPEPGTEVEIGTRVVIVVSKGAEPKPIPDLKGKTRDEAFEALEDLGLEPYEADPEFSADVDKGRVVRTDPAADTIVDGEDRSVGVVLSTAIKVPDVKGKRVNEAKQILQELGLKVEVESFGGGGQRQTVYSQDPPKDSRVEENATITLYAFG
jgi:serine/threonine-protein kinase